MVFEVLVEWKPNWSVEAIRMRVDLVREYAALFREYAALFQDVEEQEFSDELQDLLLEMLEAKDDDRCGIKFVPGYSDWIPDVTNHPCIMNQTPPVDLVDSILLTFFILNRRVA